MSNSQETGESLDSLESDGTAPEYDKLSVDEVMAKELRNIKPQNNGKFAPEIVACILENLKKGISMSTAAMAAGISPVTALNWYKQGMAEVASLTDEQLESESDMDKLLSGKGQFFIKVNKAKSECIVTIHDMLYERCFENNKEWLGTYILEREEPEKYNLKHKMMTEVDARTENKATVQFKFIDGLSERPPEDKKYIDDKLKELNKMYDGDKDGR